MKLQHYTSFRKEIEDFLKLVKTRCLSRDLKEISVTVGVTVTDEGFEWGYQTGDNSYTGGAYGHPYWVILHLTRKSNCRSLSKDAIDQLQNLII